MKKIIDGRGLGLLFNTLENPDTNQKNTPTPVPAIGPLITHEDIQKLTQFVIKYVYSDYKSKTIAEARASRRKLQKKEESHTNDSLHG